MYSRPYLCICLYCMLQLGLIIVMEIRRSSTKIKEKRYFLWMLFITFFSFAVDIASSLYIGPSWFFPFSVLANYLEVILNTLLPPLFYRFICQQISGPDSKLIRRVGLVLWIMSAVNTAVVISNAFTGLIFYYDTSRMYHRGPLFPFAMLLFLAMMAMIEGILIFQRKKIEAQNYRSLTTFMIAPLVGWTLQSFVFGLPFSLISITFAAQVVFTNRQNRNIDEDYLTGAFTRQSLDYCLQQKINAFASHGSFSAILLDIDNFKSINDRFGHYEGDMALIASVRVLRESVGHRGFISRYGGDEFCIILDNGDPNAAEETVRRIFSRLADFNQRSDKPYRLGFSMGYDVYQPSIGTSAEQFLKVIDRKMYEEKAAHRTVASPEGR
jgi:diguanylate cyclase (GGDEF)-like protein